MGKKSTIDTLPEALRAELLSNYRTQPAWTINDHTDWLSDKGFEISRSAVHRYLTTRSSIPLTPEQQMFAEQVRLSCLEVAASVYKGEDPEGLMLVAERLLSWVRTLD